jgi:hypothetical protein
VVTPLGHLSQSGNCLLAFNFDEGRQIKDAGDHNEEFKKIFMKK